MALPTDLTTSDWVDYLATLATREERVTALATFHRRIWNDARTDVLENLSAKDPDEHVIVRKIAEQEKVDLKIIPDYTDEPKPTPPPPPKVEPPVGNLPKGGK